MQKSIGFAPIIDEDTRLVILGSFPGQASLQKGEYYAFVRNQFWPIVGSLLTEPKLQEFEYGQKIMFLKQHQVGLWDIYRACIREGSLDANITAGEPNDLSQLLKWAPELKVVAHNGKASAKFMKEVSLLGVSTVTLPSTSPAHASMTIGEKLKFWKNAFEMAGVLKPACS